MSTSTDRIPAAGSSRALALELVHAGVFVLLLLWLAPELKGLEALLLVLLPAAILSTLAVVGLRTLLEGGFFTSSEGSSWRTRFSLTNILHLHAFSEELVPQEEETLELVFSDGTVFKSHPEEESSPEVEPEPEPLPVQEESGEVLVIEEEEEVVCGSGDYQCDSPCPPSDLPRLDLKRNEIKVLKKKLNLPPLRFSGGNDTPWSGSVCSEEGYIPVLEFQLKTPDTPLEVEPEIVLPGDEELPVEEVSVEALNEEDIPLIEPTPLSGMEDCLETGSIPEGELVTEGLVEAEAEVTVEEEGALECNPFDADCELVCPPGEYLGTWQSSAPPSRDYCVSTDSSFLHNSSYTLYRCNSCSVVFASSKQKPGCPSCGAQRCHKQ